MLYAKKEWRQNDNGAYMLYINPSDDKISLIEFYPEKKDDMYRCTWASEIMKIEHEVGYFNSIDDAKRCIEELVIDWIKEQISFYESYLDCLEV